MSNPFKNQPKKPSKVTNRDSTISKRDKVASQKNYARDITDRLRDLIGDEQIVGGKSRRVLNSKTIVSLMGLSERDYHRAIVKYLEIFINSLKFIDMIERETSKLSRDQVLIKKDGDDQYFLAKGFGKAFIRTIEFFLRRTTKLFTVNRKITQPRPKKIYPFILTDEGITTLKKIVDAFGSKTINGYVDDLVTRDVVYIDYQTIIRLLILARGGKELADALERRSKGIMDKLDRYYTISVRAKGAKGVIYKTDVTKKARDDFLDDSYNAFKDLYFIGDNGKPVVRSYNKFGNNSFIAKIKDITLHADFERALKANGTPDNKSVLVTEGAPSQTLTDLINKKRDIALEIEREKLDLKNDTIDEYRDIDSSKARKYVDGATASINKINEEIAKLNVPDEELSSMKVAAGITSALGHNDTGASLTNADLDKGKANIKKIKDYLERDNEDGMIAKRFIQDVANRHTSTTKKSTKSAPSGKRRGRQ